MEAPNIEFKQRYLLWAPGADSRMLIQESDRRKEDPPEGLREDLYSAQENIALELHGKVEELIGYLFFESKTLNLEGRRIGRAEDNSYKYISMLRNIFEEAIRNAWTHGNLCDSSKLMFVEAELKGNIQNWEDHIFNLRFGDQGDGFSASDVPYSMQAREKRWDAGREGGLGFIGFIEPYAHDIKIYNEIVKLADEVERNMFVVDLETYIFKDRPAPSTQSRIKDLR